MVQSRALREQVNSDPELILKKNIKTAHTILFLWVGLVVFWSFFQFFVGFFCYCCWGFLFVLVWVFFFSRNKYKSL